MVFNNHIRLQLIVSVLLISLCKNSLTAGSTVPTLIWGSDSNTLVPALSQLSGSEFIEILENYNNGLINTENVDEPDQKSTKLPIVVFVEDQLSPETIVAACRNRVSNKKCYRFLGDRKSFTYIPSVSNPLYAIEQRYGDTIERANINNILSPDQLNSEEDKRKIIIVRLGSIYEYGSVEEALDSHDNLIEQFTSKLAGRYIGIYTGAQPSIDHQKLALIRARREAAEPKQDETNPGHLLTVESHLMFYYETLIVPSSPSGSNEMVNLTSARLTQNETDLMTFVLSGTTDQNFEITFTRSAGSWLISGMQWKETALYSIGAPSSPLGTSFHCSKPLEFSTEDLKTVIQWNGLQIEPRFGDHVYENDDLEKKFNRFSYAWECVGFTSPAIWSGLFITILMLLILSIGLGWIMDIKTMDRFDDPKGKTITVNMVD